jgi:polysaccharide export outer membrane protein
MRPLLLGIGLLAVGLGAGSAGAQEDKAVRAPDDKSAAEKLVGYRIGPEDMVQVSVWNNEALSRTVPVRPDGKISLPLLNDIQAAGFTPMELRDSVIKRLADYMPNPEVSVIVTEVKSFKVSVIGSVMKPGRYEIKSSATVMDAIAMAEGLNQFASRSRIVVMRQNGRKTERIPFDYDKVRDGDGRQVNFYLRPGDIILVP